MVKSVLARRLTSTVLALAISIGALWWLLADGTGQALIDASKNASLWPLILGSLIAIVIQIVRAWRFAVLATGSLALPSWTMIGIATKLVLLNFLLPFKLGELGFPVMMKRAYGTPFAKGAGILILCRSLDFGIVTAMILIAGAWLLVPLLDPLVAPLGPGIAPWLVTAVGLMALLTPFVIADRLPWLQRLLGGRQRVADLIGQMSSGAAMMRPFRQRLLVAGLSLSIWLAHALIAWLASIAIDAGIDVLAMAMASAASNLAFALPISGVAGLGPPQAAWATMLNLAGYDWTQAITTALLCHGLLLITLSTFGLTFFAGQIVRAPSTTAR